jgi:hypothetical protein
VWHGIAAEHLGVASSAPRSATVRHGFCNSSTFVISLPMESGRVAVWVNCLGRVAIFTYVVVLVAVLARLHVQPFGLHEHPAMARPPSNATRS